MPKKIADFTREGTPFEVFQIGRNYTEQRIKIEFTLRQIYEEYKSEGVIYSLCKYEIEFMTGELLRRLIDLGIIKILKRDRKNIQYKWNSEEVPDFTELTNRILTNSKKK